MKPQRALSSGLRALVLDFEGAPGTCGDALEAWAWRYFGGDAGNTSGPQVSHIILDVNV